MTDMTEHFKTPFSIGSETFNHRLIQGPLAGISCAPFRALFARYTLPAYAVTEMLSAQDLVSRKQTKRRYVEKAPEEAPLCYQLSGHDPTVLAKAVSMVDNLGASLIDLNVGCPKPKIRQKHSGSAHLDNLPHLGRVVSVMRAVTKKPLTVKIRSAGGTDDNAYLLASQVIEDSGADAIIVHGRHWSESYEVDSVLSHIAAVKSRVSIPVIANGDLWDRKSIEHCFKQTGCDAYMLARAGIGAPWLYHQLLTPDIDITVREKIACFLTHIRLLADIEENEHIALLQGRRLLKHYFKNEKNVSEISKLYQCDTIESLNVSLNKWLV